jgi:hypothetical protein
MKLINKKSNCLAGLLHQKAHLCEVDILCSWPTFRQLDRILESFVGAWMIVYYYSSALENLEDRISPLPTSICGGNVLVHSLIEKKEIIRDKDVKIRFLALRYT